MRSFRKTQTVLFLVPVCLFLYYLNFRSSNGKGFIDGHPRRLYINKKVVLEYLTHKSNNWTEQAWNYSRTELAFAKLSEPDHVICDELHDLEKKHFRLHPELLVIEDRFVSDPSIRPFAAYTTPCMLNYTKSGIKDAGQGIFANVDLTRGLIFGPYKGILVSDYDMKKLGRGGFTWLLGTDKDKLLFVDAYDEQRSNWLRYVNSARFEEEQNLFPIHVENEMFYLLYKDVKAGVELLTWYGEDYATKLGVWIIEKQKLLALAPKRKDMVCPTCSNMQV